ncbi:hypothetical protein B0A48_12285 [Cryoendolithus antarcticus]|uniref:Uncharacterized protein n=1 Tax=Cryoendolithus antarcticus TaxID=1507870 RepID=A0A1V8SSE1_9PEZI|nr:hypothetical protein B0A48_12285 [Cryoendolithus antarcticus]
MDFLPHTRSDSSDTSSTGSSYQHILDHALNYGSSYQMPLRSMYTLNCAPRAQPLPSYQSSSSSNSPTTPITPSGWQDPSATQLFNEHLMAQMSNLPAQPASLPPSFITSFVGKCFPVELVCVDFPQALTGLDYLKDLEHRRRREVQFAMSRLDIDRASPPTDLELQTKYPGVARWLKGIDEKERKIETLYTQLYIGIRRWVLINELSLVPYNKHNCVAMLNTLYPPMGTTPPTSKLTHAALKSQRDGFFKYIQSVEKNGSRVLTNVMMQGAAPGDDNGWEAVHRILVMYLQVTNSMISDCTSVGDLDDVSVKDLSSRSTKTDSGISLRSAAAERRPSVPSGNVSNATSPLEPPRPKTPSGGRTTALEKLARGLKTIGRSRTDVAEIGSKDVMFEPSPQKTKSLRKMRSMGALSDRSRNGSQDFGVPLVESDEMRRQRKRFEAEQSRNILKKGHEV